MSPADVPPSLVLVVDDEEPLRAVLARMVEHEGHRCLQAPDAPTARSLIDEHRPALVLTDINMPGESGLTVAEHVQNHHPDTAVVIVSGVDDSEVARTAVDLGAYGYLVKPFERANIKMVVLNALARRGLEIENRQYRVHLEELVLERTDQLRASQAETIKRLAMAAEHRDPETGLHLDRMSRYSGLLAVRAGLGTHRAEVIRLASPMHDIGKIGIPDTVLTKPGVFDDQDRAVMAQHPVLGHRILDGSSSELLQVAAVIALTHHERWNGSGYPDGLAGTDIPIEGRIVAIADVFDALTSRRRYKEAFSLDRAVSILVGDAGSHFDPDLVDRFVADLDPVVDIIERFAEPGDEPGGAGDAAPSLVP